MNMFSRIGVFCFQAVLILLCVAGFKCSGEGEPTPTPTPETAPEIVKQPSSVTVDACSVTTLSVEAQGTEPLSYQWYRDGEKFEWPDPYIQDFKQGPSIQIDTNPVDDGAKYSVKVTNKLGTVDSETSVLTLTPAQTEGPEAKMLWKDEYGARKVALSDTDVAWTHGSFVYTASLPCANNARFLCLRENTMVWPQGILIHEDQVLWTDMSTGQLWIVPINGGECRKIADQGTGYRITDVVVVDGRAYWSSFGYGNNRIMSIKLDGTDMQAINVGVEGSRVDGQIETDNKYLYWIDHGTDRINRMAIGSDNVELFADNQDYVSSIFLHEGYLYWSIQEGTEEEPESQILRQSLEGGEPEVLVSQSNKIWDLAIEGNKMFWNVMTYDTEERAIWTAATDGHEEPILFQEAEGVIGIAVNSTHLYWGDEYIGGEDKYENGLFRKLIN